MLGNAPGLGTLPFPRWPTQIPRMTAATKLIQKPRRLKAAPAKKAMAGQFMLLSDPAMAPALKQLKTRIASDRKFALSLLQDAGIATPTGKLTKRFGG